MATIEIDIKKLAQYSFENVFRTTIDKPGFVNLDFGTSLDSYQLRTIMVALKNELSKSTRKIFNKNLTYHWLVRFDQQANTPYHVDNAGNQSFLMLGYEPSEIDSALYLADYYKYAAKSTSATKEYLENFTPIFNDDDALLSPYITKVAPFKKDTYKIILINNSNPKSNPETLGVFHKATMENIDLNKSRVVNSMLLNMESVNDEDSDGENELEFMHTVVVSR